MALLRRLLCLKRFRAIREPEARLFMQNALVVFKARCSRLDRDKAICRLHCRDGWTAELTTA